MDKLDFLGNPNPNVSLEQINALRRMVSYYEQDVYCYLKQLHRLGNFDEHFDRALLLLNSLNSSASELSKYAQQLQFTVCSFLTENTPRLGNYKEDVSSLDDAGII